MTTSLISAPMTTATTSATTRHGKDVRVDTKRVDTKRVDAKRAHARLHKRTTRV
jgi:hypothetical protein